MPKNYSHVIKERVKKCLKSKGTTQKQMCKELGFSEAHFCRCMKNGEIATSWIYAMAKYFDVSPEWLINEDAINLTNFAYERGQLLTNKDDVLSSLFHLCGFDPENYKHFPEFLKSGLITEIVPIIAYYIDVYDGGIEYANQRQWNLNPGQLGLALMDAKAGIGFRDDNGRAVSEEEWYNNQLLEASAKAEYTNEFDQESISEEEFYNRSIKQKQDKTVEGAPTKKGRKKNERKQE